MLNLKQGFILALTLGFGLIGASAVSAGERGRVAVESVAVEAPGMLAQQTVDGEEDPMKLAEEEMRNTRVDTSMEDDDDDSQTTRNKQRVGGSGGSGSEPQNDPNVLDADEN